MLVLNAEKRDMKARAGKVRKGGKMPAVFYGRKEKSTPIAISAPEFIKIWKKAGESSVITLKGDFGEHETLINDVDAHPVTGVPRHADFYVIEKGQKVKVKVPLEFIGVSPAIKELGGTLVKVMHDIEIEAAPKDLPKKIEVDIAALVDFNSQVLASQLKMPAGVSIAVGAQEVVASVAQFKEEVEEVVPVDVLNIELSEKKGKELKEGEEAAEGATPAAGAAPADAKKAPVAKSEKK